jgi:hypothetical protein
MSTRDYDNADVPLKTDERDADLRAFLRDSKQFVLFCMDVAMEFPLQVYCSALISSPSQSRV